MINTKMGYHPEILGLLILACSVHLLPSPDDNSRANIKTRHERRAPAGTTWSSGSRNHSRSTTNEGSDPFVFPDDSAGPVERFVPRFGKNTPECANGTTFCESVEEYPSKYLENILHDAGKQFTAMFGNDLVNDLSIVHRIDFDENPLCQAVEQVVYPKTAKNKDDQWLFVVNQGQYRQGIRIEKCVAPDNPPQSCAFTEGFPIGYKTVCRQKHIYRRLLALNEDGKTFTDSFQIPSCCACVVISDGLRSRVGSPGQKDKVPHNNLTKTN